MKCRGRWIDVFGRVWYCDVEGMAVTVDVVSCDMASNPNPEP